VKYQAKAGFGLLVGMSGLVLHCARLQSECQTPTVTPLIPTEPCPLAKPQWASSDGGATVGTAIILDELTRAAAVDLDWLSEDASDGPADGSVGRALTALFMRTADGSYVVPTSVLDLAYRQRALDCNVLFQTIGRNEAEVMRAQLSTALLDGSPAVVDAGQRDGSASTCGQ
jgi:hypothetical protein